MRIVTGNTTVGPDDSPSADVVVMDDFLYGEPQEIKPKAAQGNDGGQQQNQNQTRTRPPLRRRRVTPRWTPRPRG